MTEESKEEKGLFLVSTPIGNLEDMTFRAVRILKEVDLIAAEDTRRAKILLNHYDIKTHVISYHKFNEHGKTSSLIRQVKEGLSIAVITDAGTPSISDPGFLLVREAVQEGIEPIIIPGACALIFAAVASAFPLETFVFGGFLPVKKGKRIKALEKYKDMKETVILYESPYRIAKLIGEISETCGPKTEIAVIKEATKRFEETFRGSAEDIFQDFQNKKIKGEYVIVLNLYSKK